MRGPGTPEPFDPGRPPRTHISPEFSLRLPTMHDSSVVFPQPEAPSSPYLVIIKLLIIMSNYFSLITE